MSIFTAKRVALTFGASVAVVAAAPVVAQSIGYTQPSLVIMSTTAFTNGFTQINQTYGQNLQMIGQKEQEMGSLLKPLDTNNDGDLSDAEVAAAPKATVDRINQVNGEIQQLQTPILLSRLYVVEQIAAQYGTAQAAVVKAKKISVILLPEAFLYAPESADLTESIALELNKLIPQAAITPPQGWQPKRQTVSLYQEIEGWLEQSAMARQQQGGGAAAAPVAQPAAGDGR